MATGWSSSLLKCPVTYLHPGAAASRTCPLKALASCFPRSPLTELRADLRLPLVALVDCGLVGKGLCLLQSGLSLQLQEPEAVNKWPRAASPKTVLGPASTGEEWVTRTPRASWGTPSLGHHPMM